MTMARSASMRRSSIRPISSAGRASHWRRRSASDDRKKVVICSRWATRSRGLQATMISWNTPKSRVTAFSVFLPCTHRSNMATTFGSVKRTGVPTATCLRTRATICCSAASSDESNSPSCVISSMRSRYGCRNWGRCCATTAMPERTDRRRRARPESGAEVPSCSPPTALALAWTPPITPMLTLCSVSSMSGRKRGRCGKQRVPKVPHSVAIQRKQTGTSGCCSSSSS
mmetsp:Transcript_7568/g.19341  ORF Transcript_7568/g.19341 Transcript_7568/m.19341 type:complete len:228 (-) Transcript_7568:3085-3768(-)